MGCKYCMGQVEDGCMYCESDKPQESLMPEPMLTIDLTDEKDIERCKLAVGGEAITKAFSDGGGINEIMDNCREAKIKQLVGKLFNTNNN